MLVHDYLKFFAREQPEAPCVVLGDRILSFGQVQAQSNQLANAMLDSGLEKGERFAFLAKNSIETVIAYMAGSTAGLIPIPLNWRLAPSEWEYIIDDARPGLLFSEGEFRAGIDNIRGNLDSVRQYVSIGGSTSRDWSDFDAFHKHRSTLRPTTAIDEDDVFYQMYTSGTTGHPKGAILTHHSVLSNTMQTMPYFSAMLGPGRRTLVVMPMFHAGAASFVVGSIASGSTMVIHRDFSPERVADALSRRDINAVNLVPAMIQAMLTQVPDLQARDFSNLDVIIYGASPIAEDTLRRAMEVFDCDFFQGFGQTESSAVMTFLTAEDHRRALEHKPELLLSAGREILGTTVRIVDGEDRELPRGTSGEIVMRGPQMMKAYWNLPRESAETLRNGWLHTGDVGMLDEDGYLFVQDRIKDMIVSGGENVYPREVENVLFEHPSISDAAVIGLPDEKYGEAVTAVIVLQQGASLETSDIIDFCRGKIGGYKIPRHIRVVNELPRNPSGKVLKRELRNAALANELC